MNNEEVRQWVTGLIKQGKTHQFYTSPQWRKVSEKVKDIDKNECQWCKRQGKVTAAGMRTRKGKRVQISAHHRKEVKRYPELALSIYYTDDQGRVQRNIECICESCHYKEHNKRKYRKGKKEEGKPEKYVNEEWW